MWLLQNSTIKKIVGSGLDRSAPLDFDHRAEEWSRPFPTGTPGIFYLRVLKQRSKRMGDYFETASILWNL